MRDKGLGDDDAQESAAIIIGLRKNATGIIADFAALEKAGIKHRVMSLLRENTFLGKFTFLSVEFVGPQVGQDLRRKAALACIWALIGMLIYIAFRFKFLYGLSGILTLAHDVLIALSFILFFNIEISLQVIAALLTITGYSINDTIVVFDRLRDNLKIMKKDDLEAILDKSLNQTLSRSIIHFLDGFSDRHVPFPVRRGSDPAFRLYHAGRRHRRFLLDHLPILRLAESLGKIFLKKKKKLRFHLNSTFFYCIRKFGNIKKFIREAQHVR